MKIQRFRYDDDAVHHSDFHEICSHELNGNLKCLRLFDCVSYVSKHVFANLFFHWIHCQNPLKFLKLRMFLFCFLFD